MAILLPTQRGEARKKAATRKNSINMLWEGTQAFLAITLTIACVYATIRSGNKPESETLKNALFVVLGFYFGRTNHSRPVLEVPDKGED